MTKPGRGTATDYLENNLFHSDAECDQRSASLYTRNKKLWGKKDTFCLNLQENKLYLNLNSEFSSYVSFSYEVRLFFLIIFL